ncbi:MAG TPA: hypothetical protein VEK55_08575 [Xanthobacteraceae bacterium]|nr:hypothetical protein [Xanthobacteraceae bacterium]
MATRLPTMTGLCLMIIVSATLYAGSAAARSTGWNQVAADQAARAYAAEGKCYPANGPCPAAPGTLRADPPLYTTQRHKRPSP